jgi:subtilisin family serine protease
MKRQAALITLLFVCIAALTFMPALAQKGNAEQASQITAKFRRAGEKAIPQQYIVVLDQDAEPTAGDLFATARKADELVGKSGAITTHVYAHALNGFSVQMSEDDALKLSEDPRVSFVEEDSIMEANVTQTNPPSWGLDRIGQADLPLNNSYSYTSTGAGVNVYVIDTGIRRTHTQFGGRASVGFDAVGDGQNTNDCNGHGTHVSGTIGGSTFGVAKGVHLFAVRVLNCSGSGTNSGVIAGVDWVTANRIRPAVANMSLGGGVSAALDTAVRNSIAAGVTYSIAAGNSNADAAYLFAGAGRRGDHGRIEHEDRRAFVILELRLGLIYLRPVRPSYPPTSAATRDSDAERDLDGGASRSRSGCSLPAE